MLGITISELKEVLKDIERLKDSIENDNVLDSIEQIEYDIDNAIDDLDSIYNIINEIV